MLFAQIWIERADVSLRVNMQLDCRIGDLEKPGLRIMGARGQNRGAYQRERRRSIVCGVAPILPRLVGRSLTDAEHSLIAGTPDAPAHNRDGDNSRAFQEGSPPHEAPPQTLSPGTPPPQYARN